MTEKQKFENLLSYNNNIEKKMLHDLKKSTLPLIIWGAGDVACAVLKYLKINEISPAMIWVDNLESDNIFEGLTVTSLENIKKLYPKFNVVLGHSNYDLGNSIIKKEKQINEIYYFVNILYSQYNNVSSDFVSNHTEQYYKTYQILEDDLSKSSMIAYLNCRMNNNINYIKSCYSHNQTYFKNDIFEINTTENYVDVGAYNGDTIEMFLSHCNNRYNQIFAFEPEESNFLSLQEYINKKNLNNVTLYKTGTWNKKTTLYFDGNDEQRSSISLVSNECQIQVDKLDNILLNHPISFIKINFLNGVLETLQGAEQIIKKNRPKLAITVGFNEWAIIHIPQYLKKIIPDYQLYLRYNRCMPGCLTLYAK